MYRSLGPGPSNSSYQNHRYHERNQEQYHHHNRLQYLGNESVNFDQPLHSSREYWCETCDRDFKTFQLLENHKQQHQKCNIDGCQFIAHPKVITKHIQMQHSSGLYKKIAKLANPEEIEKWREERKKKYPTKENIDKKNAQVKEKIERGEKMGLRKGYPNRNSKSADLKRSHDKISRKGNKNTWSSNKKSKCPTQPTPPKLFPEPLQKRFILKPFAGIQDLVDSDTEKDFEVETNLDIIDDEDTERVGGAVVDQPTLCGALNSLINDYGSSDEEPDKKFVNPEPEIIEKNKNIKSFPPVSNGNNNGDSDSGPEEVGTAKAHNKGISDEPKKLSTTETKKILGKVKPKFSRNYKPKVPSTLLQKLLQKEVQHERNIILQCVRYVVEKKYFNNEDDKKNP